MKTFKCITTWHDPSDGVSFTRTHVREATDAKHARLLETEHNLTRAKCLAEDGFQFFGMHVQKVV